MSVDLPSEPYVGLTPFEEAHASFFFGREEERRLLAASILSSRLTLLYGESGVGKSSLLRAGLVRDFRESAARSLQRGRLPSSLLVVFADWRDDPLAALASAVESAARDQLGDLCPEPPPAEGRLDELLLAWTRRLEERAAEIAPGRRRTPHELLLVLDQFEEYFLYHGDDGFAVEFPQAVMRADLRASFLIAIREDAYTQLDRFEGRIRNLFSSNFRLEHLDGEAARTAIEGPIARYNELLPAEEAPYAIEPALVDAVLHQVRAGSIALGQAGAGGVDGNGQGELRVATPFLQLVMTRLWNEERAAGSRVLRLATLERLGGAERMVRGHLEQAMADLTPEAQALVADAFAQLVTPSGTKIVHTLPDLAAYAHTTEDELAPALRTLTERRILRPVDPPPGETSPRFEIFHDVLAPAILDWGKGHELAAENAAQAALHRRARRRLAVIAGISLVLVVVFAGLAVWALAQRRHAAQQERAARSAERAARSQALAASSASQLAADPELALLLAIRAADEGRTPEAESALRRAITESRLRRVFPSGSPTSMAVSPDGGLVATVDYLGRARIWGAAGPPGFVQLSRGGPRSTGVAFDATGRIAVTAGRDGSARMYDAGTGRLRASVRAGTAALVAARLSRDGRRLITVGRGGAARVFDVPSGKPLGGVSATPPLRAFMFSPRQEAVLLSGRGGAKLVWRWQASERPVKVAGPVDAVSDDGRVAITSPIALLPGQDIESIRAPVRIVDPRTGKTRTLAAPGGAQHVSFSPTGRLMAAASGSNARVWDTRSGELDAVLRGHVYDITGLSFSADGEEVLTAGFDGTARVWRATTGEPLAVLSGPQGSTRADFSGDGRSVLTASADHSVRTWLARQDPARFARRLPAAFESPPVAEVGWSRDGSRLLASSPGYVYVIDGTSGRIVRSVVAMALPNGFAAFSRDARFIARGDGVRNAATGALVWRAPSNLSTGAFRWDSRALAFADTSGRIGLWTSGSPRARFLGRDRDAGTVDFTQSGDVVVEDSTTEKAFVWPVSGAAAKHPARRPYDAIAQDGKVAASVSGPVVQLWRRDARAGFVGLHGKQVAALAFSPDDSTIAIGSLDGNVLLRRLAGGTETNLRGHTGGVYSISFSPDGNLVATAGADGTVRVWQTDTGATVAVYRPGRKALSGAAFSPDGRLIAAGGDDRVVSVLDCEPCRPFGELVRLARSRATRKLTPQEQRQFLGRN